jgi:glycogen synthase
MKVLIISNIYPPIIFGGYEILCSQVGDELKKKGHEITILTSEFLSQEIKDEEGIYRCLKLTSDYPKEGENVGYVDFSLKRINKIAKINLKKTLQIIKKTSPDIVFCWCLNRITLGPIFAAQKTGIPVCYTINDEHPKQFNYTKKIKDLHSLLKKMAEFTFWNKATFRKLNYFPITIISHALKNKLVSVGTPVKTAKIIYQGVPLEKFNFKPTNFNGAEIFKIIYAGQLSKVKGVHTILQALSSIINHSKAAVSLDIVGTGVPEYTQYLKTIVTQNNISEYVNFIGKLSQDQLIKQYHSHHALIFSSEWDEPFGLTHLEAMACGCAVISTTTGGSAELINDNYNALAYEAGNSNMLYKKISSLILDVNKRKLLIKNARVWVEENHSLTIYVNNIDDFLKKTIIMKKNQVVL